jgi:hypothetical protein
VEYEGFATDTFDNLGSYSGGGGSTLSVSVTPNSIAEAGGTATGTVNVLANDSDIDGTLGAVSIASNPASGTVAVGDSGRLYYAADGVERGAVSG